MTFVEQLGAYANFATILGVVLYVAVLIVRGLRRPGKSAKQEPPLEVPNEAWQAHLNKQAKRRIDRCSLILSVIYTGTSFGFMFAPEFLNVGTAWSIPGNIMFGGLILMGMIVGAVAAVAKIVTKSRRWYYRYLKRSVYAI